MHASFKMATPLNILQAVYIVDLYDNNNRVAVSERTFRLDYLIPNELLPLLPAPNKMVGERFPVYTALNRHLSYMYNSKSQVNIRVRMQTASDFTESNAQQRMPTPPPGIPRQFKLYALQRNNGDVLLDMYWKPSNNSATVADKYLVSE